MAGLSKSALLTWLRQAPRTRGWGAILAFNRSDTNTVLQQAYIERFSTGHYLPPIQGFVGDNSTVWQYISDYVLDCPQLSFEIADPQQRIPDARLKMHVVGGTQVTFEAIAGGLKATRVEVVDPLNGPELTLNVQLQAAPASITSAGKVQIDLANSSDFSLSYSDDEREQRLGGEFFKELFEKTPVDKRVMVISEVTRDANNPIKPARLQIRTQAADGARVRSAENYGDGAVVVLVAMEGQADGEDLDSTFNYLIPNDADDATSATLLLSSRLIMDKVIGQALRDTGSPGSSYYLKSDAQGFTFVEGKSGQNELPTFETEIDGYGCSVLNRTLMFGSVGSDSTRLVIRVSNDRFRMDWTGYSDDNFIARTQGSGSPDRYYGITRFEWVVEAFCQYAIDQRAQAIKVEDLLLQRIDNGVTLQQPSDAVTTRLYPSLRVPLQNRYIQDVVSVYPRLLTKFPAINVFVLGALLFKNSSVVLDDMATPGDMVIFGRVGPSRTRFTLDPVHTVIGAGDTLTFTTRPEGVSGLTWKLENILGSTDDPGCFSLDTQQYKAPTRLESAFIRVKITATGGGHSSSALITVVASKISLSPLIQVCNAGHSRSFSWVIQGSYFLAYYLKTAKNGAQLTSDGHGTLTYVAPGTSTEKAYVVDEIVIKNVLTGRTRSAWVLALLATMGLSVVRDRAVSLPAGQIKLKVTSGTSVIDDAALTWQTLAGSGAVSNGIYTQPATLEQRFALLLATWVIRPDMPELKQEGYILLPLPLFDYPEQPVPGLHFMTVAGT